MTNDVYNIHSYLLYVKRREKSNAIEIKCSNKVSSLVLSLQYVCVGYQYKIQLPFKILLIQTKMQSMVWFFFNCIYKFTSFL